MEKKNDVLDKDKHEVCYHPCTECNKGLLDNGELCPVCAGTGCRDKKLCEPSGGLGCEI